jgi:hypothetical protein
MIDALTLTLSQREREPFIPCFSFTRRGDGFLTSVDR